MSSVKIFKKCISHAKCGPFLVRAVIAHLFSSGCTPHMVARAVGGSQSAAKTTARWSGQDRDAGRR